MRISDWSSDVCSSDLLCGTWRPAEAEAGVSGDSRGFRMTRRGPVADVTGVGRCPRVSYKGSDSRASRDYLDETYFSRRIRGTGRPCSLSAQQQATTMFGLAPSEARSGWGAGGAW